MKNSKDHEEELKATEEELKSLKSNVSRKNTLSKNQGV